MQRHLPFDPWLGCYQPRSRAELRLFCFPHAGGGASLFRGWDALLPAAVEVCPVQLPGREARFREPAFSRMDRLIDALSEGLSRHLDRPFAFFGHSMGALVSFELARSLRPLGVEPVHLFVSGCGAPQIHEDDAPIHQLPDREFRQELRRLGGTPAEALDHDELMELLLPVLRADFTLCETYRYERDRPLDCPITAFGGLQDRAMARGSLTGWSEQTTGPFQARMLPGDHFFPQTEGPRLLDLLGRELVQHHYAIAPERDPVAV